jgi:tRNA threonylcarbamoyladenosine biosynthesis protein TsaB
LFIVGLDTSGKEGGIALVEATIAGVRVLGASALGGRMYSAEIIPQLTALLAAASLPKAGMDAFAVVSGPGSFTGLRVGLATIKALADVWSKPIAAVSMLELLAAQHAARSGADAAPNITVVMDAGRGELFAATYSAENPAQRNGDEMLLKLEEFWDWMGKPGVSLITPDESVAVRLRAANLAIEQVPRPTAAEVATCGHQMLQHGRVTGAATLDANYVRRSDAELYMKAAR